MSVADRCLRACAPGPDSNELYGAVVAELARSMPIVGACWHETDPESGLPITAGRVGHPPGDFHRSLQFEFARHDVSRFAELADRRDGVGLLSQETHGELVSSPRYREMIEPEGGADELRVAFADAFGMWGCMTLFSSTRLEVEHGELLSKLAPTLTRSLRIARVRGAESEQGGPGVILLDSHDRPTAIDPRAHELLPDLAPTEEMPGLVYVLAALARIRDPSRPATACTTDAHGRWLAIDATPMGEGPRSAVAIVVQPGPEMSLLDTMFRAYALSERERQVAVLAVRGRTTKEIAGRLFLSPWTVQDHLKSIFEKTSVGTRGELATLASITVARR